MGDWPVDDGLGRNLSGDTGLRLWTIDPALVMLAKELEITYQ
jgi:hypothetical protein